MVQNLTHLCRKLEVLQKKKKKNISQINLKLPITTWIQGATRIMRSQELSEVGFTNTILGGKLELYSSLNLPFAAAS